MKICLVTGGSRGIGAATVAHFAHRGYTVIANYNNSKTQAEQLRARLVGEGCDVHLFQADVSSLSSLDEMFDWVGKYFKKLDVLVNNAGIALTKQLQDVSEREFDLLVSTDVKSAFFCCQKALPLLQKTHGSIVNVSSVWGVEGASCESVYSLAKHAVVGLTRSLALELAPTGISVSCVCPPIVQTDMCARLSDEDKAAFCAQHGTKLYTPQMVASDIFRLATEQNSGTILVE